MIISRSIQRTTNLILRSCSFIDYFGLCLIESEEQWCVSSRGAKFLLPQPPLT